MTKKINIQKFWQYVAEDAVKVEGKPHILTDGLMIDMHHHNIDKTLLTYRAVNAKSLNNIFSHADTPLTSVIFIDSGKYHKFFICTACIGESERLMAQRYFVKYFDLVYPGSTYLVTANRLIVFVLHKLKLVGAFAPIYQILEGAGK